jgi:hypothetical protein
LIEQTLGPVTAEDKTRADIAGLAATLRGSLEKIVQHDQPGSSRTCC